MQDFAVPVVCFSLSSVCVCKTECVKWPVVRSLERASAADRAGAQQQPTNPATITDCSSLGSQRRGSQSATLSDNVRKREEWMTRQKLNEKLKLPHEESI